MYDVLIVGGGPAGLSAALILGRCRRHVLVCDGNEPRNAVSPAVHGFLSREGVAPWELRRIARAELAAYPTIELRDIVVEHATWNPDGWFVATLANGDRVEARRMLLATGVVDRLPDVPGVRELYGKTVWHCAYCDGYEVSGRSLAVYGRGARAVAEMRALTRYSDDLVLCSDGDAGLDDGDRACLSRIRAIVRPEQIQAVEPRPNGLAIIFRDGEVLERGALFFSMGTRPRSLLAEHLGCRLDENGLIDTEDNQAAGVPGLFIAGDASRSALLAIVAAGEGAIAAQAINKGLLREDLGE